MMIRNKPDTFVNLMREKVDIYGRYGRGKILSSINRDE